MAKPHWQHPDNGFGCQHSSCGNIAVYQWQRTATETEETTEQHQQGPYGEVIRNPTGPHTVAVFSCAEHAPHLDIMAVVHASRCPAPDAGCVCNMP